MLMQITQNVTNIYIYFFLSPLNNTINKQSAAIVFWLRLPYNVMRLPYCATGWNHTSHETLFIHAILSWLNVINYTCSECSFNAFTLRPTAQLA